MSLTLPKRRAESPAPGQRAGRGRKRPWLGAVSILAFALSAPLAGPEAEEKDASPDSAERAWSYEGVAYGYLFEGGEGDFILPIVYANRGALHLEARYNYEDRDTGSLFGGWTFSFGDETTLDLTPMLGAVFGNTDGIAPGLELDFNWRWLEYYSETEYVFDLEDHESNFFYAWSELSGRPVDWLRLGLAVQRTRAYETERDVQRGIVVGFSFWKMEVGAYYFNPDDEEPFGILSAAISF